MPQPFIYLDINDNKAVITYLKAGEERAFDAVYRYYFSRLCGFCSQYVNEQEEIEEIVQGTMMWLWENRCSLMEDLTLKTLLFTIVKNKALKQLPAEFRETYDMNRNQRLTHKEIAEKLNVSPQTVNYRIGQALKLLRIALKDYLPLFILCFGTDFLKKLY